MRCPFGKYLCRQTESRQIHNCGTDFDTAQFWKGGIEMLSRRQHGQRESTLDITGEHRSLYHADPARFRANDFHNPAHRSLKFDGSLAMLQNVDQGFGQEAVPGAGVLIRDLVMS